MQVGKFHLHSNLIFKKENAYLHTFSFLKIKFEKTNQIFYVNIKVHKCINTINNDLDIVKVF